MEWIETEDQLANGKEYAFVHALVGESIGCKEGAEGD
jgi:hypothetical protein